MSKIDYNGDVYAWANRQANLLAAQNWDALDLENLIEEVLEVGKSELRQLENRLIVLLAHLLKWRYQGERRGVSWQLTIKEQRKRIGKFLIKMPSLQPFLENEEWVEDVKESALALAARELGDAAALLPEAVPAEWTIAVILKEDFLPS